MISKVFWEIVPGEKCNLKCIGCYAANESRPDYRIINKDAAIIIAKKLIELDVQKIDFLGGEPLLCNFVDEIILEFKIRNPSIFIGIVSNGTLLTKERANNLKKAGLNQISISLDGVTIKTNDWSRGKGSFLKILQGVENAKNAGLDVSISYTITKKSLVETEKFIHFAEKIGAKSIGVQITEKDGRAVLNWDKIGFLREKGLEAVLKIFHKKPKIFVGISSRIMLKEFINYFFNANLPITDERCNGGNEDFMISSGGDLMPCSLYAYADNSENIKSKKIINLIRDDIKTIIGTIKKHYLFFNKLMRYDTVQKFLTCKECAYHLKLCDPCPLTNLSEKINECEWVKEKFQFFEKLILESKVILKIKPDNTENKTILSVPAQSTPLYVNIKREKFIQIFGNGLTGKEIFSLYLQQNQEYSENDVRKMVIGFLAKLRSHEIIEMSHFPLESFKAIS